MFEKIIEHPGKRLDVWLTEMDGERPRAYWQSLIRDGYVTVNGMAVKKNFRLHKNDHVIWSVPEPVSTEIQPENIPLEILYEDQSIIVINKPAGLVVHPAVGNRTGTLANALLHHCGELAEVGNENRPGIVHRLDKDTSGVMIAVKTQKAYEALTRQFKNREVEKEYTAIVSGIPSPQTGRIETTIGRHPFHRKKMAVNVRNGRQAVSNYEVIENLGITSVNRINIETGRTHQIRLHMAYIKHPILGDQLYARPKPLEIWPNRQMLHASKLKLTHPDTGERMAFSTPLAADMCEMLYRLRTMKKRQTPSD